MSEWNSEQKTEEPTQHQLEEAKKRGDVPRSRDLIASFALLGVFAVIKFCGGDFFRVVCEMSQSHLKGLAQGTSALTPERLAHLFAASGLQLSVAFLPLAAATFLVATASGVLQGGCTFRFTALGPDVARLNPFDGFRKLFRLRSCARGVFAMAKVGLVSWALYGGLSSFLSAATSRAELGAEGFSLKGSWSRFGDAYASLGIKISLLLVGFGLLDYLFQRWIHSRESRMTRVEVLEEILRIEGNPDLKKRRRRVLTQFPTRNEEE
jgi:flagellar biosynthetic protein FlhB